MYLRMEYRCLYDEGKRSELQFSVLQLSPFVTLNKSYIISVPCFFIWKSMIALPYVREVL